MNTVLVNDGYNGHKIKVYTHPVLEETEAAVKLKVAEKGKEYMFKWVWKSELTNITASLKYPHNI